VTSAVMKLAGTEEFGHDMARDEGGPFETQESFIRMIHRVGPLSCSAHLRHIRGSDRSLKRDRSRFPTLTNRERARRPLKTR